MTGSHEYDEGREEKMLKHTRPRGTLRHLLKLACLGTGVAGLLAGVAVMAPTDTYDSTRPLPARIVASSVPEDSVDFNCLRDGNHRCGKGAPADGYVNRDCWDNNGALSCWRPAYAAVCSGVPWSDFSDCLTLAARPARRTRTTSDPNGLALVVECRSQYRGAELSACLTQP